MTDWTEISRINSEDGKHYLTILSSKSEIFCFVEHTQFVEEEPYQTYSYFSPTHQSGIYGSAVDAERDARLQIPWLRDKISD